MRKARVDPRSKDLTLSSVARLEQVAEQNSLIKRGIHDEIYLVDFTKGCSQENFKTILRGPVDNK